MCADVEQDNFLLRHSKRQCQSIRMGDAHRMQSFQPALFMTIRREIAQSPSETGKHSREGQRHT
jgi:hypothetical protein